MTKRVSKYTNTRTICEKSTNLNLSPIKKQNIQKKKYKVCKKKKRFK